MKSAFVPCHCTRSGSLAAIPSGFDYSTIALEIVHSCVVSVSVSAPWVGPSWSSADSPSSSDCYTVFGLAFLLVILHTPPSHRHSRFTVEPINHLTSTASAQCTSFTTASYFSNCCSTVSTANAYCFHGAKVIVWPSHSMGQCSGNFGSVIARTSCLRGHRHHRPRSSGHHISWGHYSSLLKIVVAPPDDALS